MRRWVRAQAAAVIVTGVLAGWPTALSAAPCDEFNPFGPARTAHITLDGTEILDIDNSDEMLSFVETGSLGRVDVSVLSSMPHGVVRHISAVPHVSRLTREAGEHLKGVELALSLNGAARHARVVLSVRQVCARHFRHTFLHY